MYLLISNKLMKISSVITKLNFRSCSTIGSPKNSLLVKKIRLSNNQLTRQLNDRKNNQLIKSSSARNLSSTSINLFQEKPQNEPPSSKDTLIGKFYKKSDVKVIFQLRGLRDDILT